MPHGARTLPRLALRLVACAALAASCGGETRPSAAGAGGTTAAVPPGRAASGTQLAGTPNPLADSAAELDARFQRERSAINAEAAAMDTMARTSPAYAERYAAHRRRVEEAERLRARRDSLRARLAASSGPAPAAGTARP